MSERAQIVIALLFVAMLCIVPSVHTLWKFRNTAVIPVLAVLLLASGIVFALCAIGLAVLS